MAVKPKTSPGRKLPKRPKPVAVPTTVTPPVLTKEEMTKLHQSFSELNYLKDRHTRMLTDVKIANAEHSLALAQVEKAEQKAATAAQEAQRVEKDFNELQRHEIELVANICEKRGITYQELEYNQTTGELLNIKGE